MAAGQETAIGSEETGHEPEPSGLDAKGLGVARHKTSTPRGTEQRNASGRHIRLRISQAKADASGRTACQDRPATVRKRSYAARIEISGKILHDTQQADELREV